MRVIAAAVLLLVTAGAAAQGGLYYGVLGTGVIYEDDTVDDQWRPVGLTAKLGQRFTDRLAIEGRVGTTTDDTQSVLGVDVDLKVDYYASAFGRFDVTTGAAKLYGLAGVTHGKLSADADTLGIGDSESDTGLSYGVGLDLYGNEHLAVTVEYIRHIDDDDYTIDAANLGFTYSF